MSPPRAVAEPADDPPVVKLVEQRTVDIRNSRLIALSPDGVSIAVSRPVGPRPLPTDLCIHDVATLAERVCADVSDLRAGLWPDSVVWSPDSDWLAFAELWPQFFLDGDLWLMDADSGALANLLDDAYDGVLESAATDDAAPEGDITLPSHPTFTPDSAAVTFSRSLLEEGELAGTDLATVTIEDGEVVRLGGLHRGGPGFDLWGKQWTDDGARLYVSLVEYQESGLGSDSGIWVVEVDGEGVRQILGLDGWPPRLIDVSPSGKHLLVLDPTTLGRNDPSYALVDGVSGAVDPIAPLSQEGDRSAGVTGAMLSPDGSLLLTVSGRGEKQVAVRDVAGSSETVLPTQPSGDASSDLAGEVLTWAENDTVLVNGARHGRGTLLVLDRGD